MTNEKVINLIEGKLKYLKLKLEYIDINKEQKDYYETKIELKRLDYLLEKAKYKRLLESKGKIPYQYIKQEPAKHTAKIIEEGTIKVVNNLTYIK